MRVGTGPAWPNLGWASVLLIFATLLFSSELALAQFTQQGPKLYGTGAVGPYTNQGWSVALSGDGNTAIVGGPNAYNAEYGAAWIYTRSGGVWTRQGTKLVGTGAVAAANQGWSVSLSADSNTAIMGGPSDNAAWIFVHLTEKDCKNGGWLNFPSPPGPFTSQSQCTRYFAKQSQ
jgi:hypothetical protein